jgi:hypothetical protein
VVFKDGVVQSDHASAEVQSAARVLSRWPAEADELVAASACIPQRGPILREDVDSLTRVRQFVLAGAVLVMAGMTPVLAMAAGATDGLTIPAADPSLVFVAPSPDQPNYSARLGAFLQVTVPEMFLSTYNDNGGVDVIGLPTSAPKTEPSNPNFTYQRFQNAVLFYNATEGTTSVLSLG